MTEIKYGMDFKEYRAKTDFVSVSELKLFADSPYKYEQKYIKKEQPESYKPSSGQGFGTLCHTLLLEPELFDHQYYISDVRKDERTKAFQEVKALAGDKNIISPAEYERARKVAASSLLRMSEEGIDRAKLKSEVSVFCDKRNVFPLPVKSRFDLYDAENEIIYDYKTTASFPDNDTISKEILNFRYYWQAPFYCDIHKAVTRRQPKGFVWIFVQTEFPYPCQIYKTAPEMLDIGRLEYREKLRELAEANRYDYFPVMRPQKKTISLPGFYVSRILKDCKAIEEKTNDNNNRAPI